MAGPIPTPRVARAPPPTLRDALSGTGRLVDMPWHECKQCGWWQRSAGACKGCSPLGARTQHKRQGPSKPLEAAQVALTPQLLQERWNKARTSALDPSHRRVERLCKHCFSKTLSKTGPCRGCNHPMTNCLQIHPGQWPQPMEVESAAPTTERPLEHLSVPQIKAEIARLERHLLDLAADAFHGLRDSLEQNLALCRNELKGKQSPGQTLDQATSKLRIAQKARQAAQEQVTTTTQMLRSPGQAQRRTGGAGPRSPSATHWGGSRTTTYCHTRTTNCGGCLQQASVGRTCCALHRAHCWNTTRRRRTIGTSGPTSHAACPTP